MLPDLSEIDRYADDKFTAPRTVKVGNFGRGLGKEESLLSHVCMSHSKFGHVEATCRIRVVMSDDSSIFSHLRNLNMHIFEEDLYIYIHQQEDHALQSKIRPAFTCQAGWMVLLSCWDARVIYSQQACLLCAENARCC